MKRILIFTVLLTMMAGAATAQILKPVKWTISVKKVSEGVYDVLCKATIDATWHLYDTKLPEGGPLPTTFHVDTDETDGVELVDEFKATTKPRIEKSEAFNMELAYFANTATLVQRVKLTKEKAKLVGYVEFMACNNGQCIPPAEEEFEFELTK
ncbi:MAG: disulfide bond formation protein DsbD [Odoribacteraceae bacterium]|nr:disulfide bond formation protein DsbD [Odoribacteraceae bacterium]